MKPARFHPEAEVELTSEAKYYEERSPGLGKRFIQEVQAAIQLISTFPKIGAPHKYGTRRVFPRKFPFSIVYQELALELVILAIAPFPRKPAYWRGRKSGG
ncbi:MAG: type II toxin-antitoxin system RelE/ParE family toxin [Candidatus Nitricoxidivorans perseverans]|uniref:Type II toxin-antitoxin system RelE/ParE family toxin n=1 Tax=Candidatus Nitricoxidivorans perseverans TaxID=2975601 RepID=A0AA49FJT6_9PROT|nr:MAG: type II toxin-antitoxin system RelE/ParE family toxin [Candidatus Nitricoxidivorans perseverans]